MRTAVLIASLALPLPAFAQQRPASPPVGQSITVTGVRLQDFRDRLAACLARHCPVNEDADATLALAEALFLNGAYGDAREAVHASLRRNGDRARDFPEPVADLYRAHARISRHMGYDADALRSAHGILNALDAGIPTTDHRHFTARLELAEMDMLMGRYPNAQRQLNMLVREARQAGRQDVAAIAWLRGVWYNYMNYPHGDAKSLLIRTARSTDPDQRIHAIGARILLARIYRAEGDDARASAMLAEVGRGGASAHRRLLHSPAYVLLQQEVRLPDDTAIDEAVRFGDTLQRVTEDYRNRWIDVGFWVLPDGHVSGLEIVRRGASADWAEPLLDSIGRRVYSAAPEASYRLERYTMTGRLEGETGSRLRRHSPNARAEYLDLTVEDQPPAPPPGGPATERPQPSGS
jgi:hypothetical protein